MNSIQFFDWGFSNKFITFTINGLDDQVLNDITAIFIGPVNLDDTDAYNVSLGFYVNGVNAIGTNSGILQKSNGSSYTLKLKSSSSAVEKQIFNDIRNNKYSNLRITLLDVTSSYKPIADAIIKQHFVDGNFDFLENFSANHTYAHTLVKLKSNKQNVVEQDTVGQCTITLNFSKIQMCPANNIKLDENRNPQFMYYFPFASANVGLINRCKIVLDNDVELQFNLITYNIPNFSDARFWHFHMLHDDFTSYLYYVNRNVGIKYMKFYNSENKEIYYQIKNDFTLGYSSFRRLDTTKTELIYRQIHGTNSLENLLQFITGARFDTEF